MRLDHATLVLTTALLSMALAAGLSLAARAHSRPIALREWAGSLWGLSIVALGLAAWQLRLFSGAALPFLANTALAMSLVLQLWGAQRAAGRTAARRAGYACVAAVGLTTALGGAWPEVQAPGTLLGALLMAALLLTTAAVVWRIALPPGQVAAKVAAICWAVAAALFLGRAVVLAATLGEPASASHHMLLPQALSWLVLGVAMVGGNAANLAVVQGQLEAKLEQTREQVGAVGRMNMVQSQIEAKLERLSRRDELTGALNRRGILMELEACVARVARYQRPAALVCFDVDHFKSINDRFSHAMGDRVLIAVSSHVQAMLRVPDCLGRLGGDEFCILLPETSLAGATTLAERICRALPQAVAQACPEVGEITLSLGVASLEGADPKVDAWLHAADLALYAAKREGRNRVVAAPVGALAAPPGMGAVA